MPLIMSRVALAFACLPRAALGFRSHARADSVKAFTNVLLAFNPLVPEVRLNKGAAVLWMRGGSFKVPSGRGSATMSERGHLGSSTDQQAEYTLDWGNTLKPGDDGTGGWLAHRSDVGTPGSGPGENWVLQAAEDRDGTVGADLTAAAAFTPPGARLKHKPRVLVLYGSLRGASFSRMLAYECARLLELMGAEVRVFNPHGLPVRDPSLEDHPKVVELRALSLWSESHVWVSPEMHGCITGAFKNQVDWLPLNTGSVRPTQGRTCAVLQVNGGSQSFNAVNELRRLARWMRMPCTVNQSSVAKAWKEFDEHGRMKPSSFRERVVDVMEEHIKFTRILREHADFLVDRYSERKEIVEQGRLRTQEEKEGAQLIEQDS